MAKRKKKWGRFRSRLYLMAMIAGFITYIWNYEIWFAFNGYRVEAESNIIEKRLWEVFPQRCLSFWPYFLKDSKGLKEFLESDMPVKVETRMEGLGKFVTKIEWLKAWLKVEWRGQIWCISRDGKMWLFEQGSKNEDNIGNLIWKIEENEANEELKNIQVPPGGVFKTPIKTEIMSSFLNEFNNFKWFEAAEEITWESRAGMNLFIVKLKNKTQKFELYLQPDKYPGQDVGQSIEDIFSKLMREGGNHIIDATYEGKISLRSL